MTTINMQTIRYINLFRRVARVNTKDCFVYNNSIIYVVPGSMMRQALGDNGKNIKMIQETLGKKIRVVKEARDNRDVQRFIQDIVDPVSFKSLEVKEGHIILTAGSIGKAALIGRNKRRLIELSKIMEDYFGKELKIV